MKKYIIILISILTVGCTSTGVQVTFDDEKIKLNKVSFSKLFS